MTSAYRALLEALNAARTDEVAPAHFGELLAWGKNLDQQSLDIYQSANTQLSSQQVMPR